MRDKLDLFIHLLYTIIRLLKPGGAEAVMAETLVTNQQLIVLSRGKTKSPNLTGFDRFFFGFMAIFISENRLKKVAVILKPVTILSFQRALVQSKYSKFYSNKTVKSTGR